MLNWIMSDGGPLVCIEESLSPAWGGLARLTIETSANLHNDYERACECKPLLSPLSLSGGQTLVLGDQPFDTTFWQAANGVPHIIRARWAEPSTDFEGLLAAMKPSDLERIEDDISFVFGTQEIIIFDALDDGRDDYSKIMYSLKPGKYKISTKLYEPDDLTSMFVHELVEVTEHR